MLKAMDLKLLKEPAYMAIHHAKEDSRGETCLISRQAPKAVALKAESVSKNLLASIDIHASIDVADAQLLSYNRCNINNFNGFGTFCFCFWWLRARIAIVNRTTV